MLAYKSNTGFVNASWSGFGMLSSFKYLNWEENHIDVMIGAFNASAKLINPIEDNNFKDMIISPINNNGYILFYKIKYHFYK